MAEKEVVDSKVDCSRLQNSESHYKSVAAADQNTKAPLLPMQTGMTRLWKGWLHGDAHQKVMESIMIQRPILGLP